MEKKAKMDQAAEKFQTDPIYHKKGQPRSVIKKTGCSKILSKISKPKERHAPILKNYELKQAAELERRSFLIFLTEAKVVEQELKDKLTQRR